MERTLLAQRVSAAREYHLRGQREQAERLLTETLAAVPHYPDALEYAGFMALEAGNFETAIDRLGRAIDCGKNAAATHLLLGRAHKGAGQLDAAVASYRRAILEDGRLVDAHVSLGIALRARGDAAEAAQSYRQALTLNP